MNCPKCGSARIAVRESRRCHNGTRRRRLDCLDCDQRWTEWDGPRPDPKEAPRRKRSTPMRPKRNPLTTEQVRFALSRLDLNNTQVARELGCIAETVRQIRAGMIYRDVFPTMLRPKEKRKPPEVDGPMCDRCSYWSDGKCGFGFPDPLVEGLSFAADCELYEVTVPQPASAR